MPRLSSAALGIVPASALELPPPASERGPKGGFQGRCRVGQRWAFWPGRS